MHAHARARIDVVRIHTHAMVLEPLSPQFALNINILRYLYTKTDTTTAKIVL